MNFGFSEEQDELRKMVRRFLEEKSPETEVRRLMATEEGYDPAVWSQMANELALQGLGIPEEFGGQGYGPVELYVVFEEMGAALLCAPYFSTVALAANALLFVGNEKDQAAYLPGIASGETIATLAITEENGKWDLGKWDHGERYAHSMINDFRNWVCGWIDWNIVLDQGGGPNHVGNFCDAPVIVNTETGEVRYENSFYYIGHFSRFVHPGAARIESHGGPAGLESVAFANPDGGLAVVVLNTSGRPSAFQLQVGGTARPCSIPAHAIQTYVGTL